MKQWQLEKRADRQQLVLSKAPVPEPAQGELIIRTIYTALNPMDVAIAEGRVQSPSPVMPVIPGMESGGRVVAVGKDVDSSWLGRVVLSNRRYGGYAEYQSLPVNQVEVVDGKIRLEAAVAWRACGRTAWHLLHTAHQLQSGQQVLVHSGAGAVGLMALQLARLAGARVLGLAGGPEKVARAGEFSGCDLIDYLDPDWTNRVQEWSGGDGVDLILDGVQGPRANENYPLLAPMGKVIYFGSMSGSPAPAVEPRQLFMKSHQVAGFMLAHVDPDRRAMADKKLLELLRAGQLRAPISKIAPFEEIPRYFQLLKDRALWGRVLFRVSEED